MTLVWNVKSAGYFSTNTKSTLISRQGCDWSAIMDVPSARQEVASCPIPTPCAQVLIETGYSITLTKKIVPLLRFQHTAFVLFHLVNNDFITNRDFLSAPTYIQQFASKKTKHLAMNIYILDTS